MLGVPPGATAEDVKRAFRARIKQFHPDTAAGGEQVNETALLLIEAYQALKEGAPPPRFKDTAQGKEYFRRQREEAFRAREEMYRRRREAAIHDVAREAGRRLYEEMFGGQQTSEARDVFWERLSDLVFGGSSSSRYYGENVELHEIHPGVRMGVRERKPPRNPSPGRAEPLRARSHPGEPSDPGQRFLDRAEALLRQVVERYDVPGSLRRRDWIREYMAGLNNCQILFRDVAVRYPALSMVALGRVRQIQELRDELRRM